MHEVKFDGWRVQLHKNQRGVAIYTKRGHDYTKRFPALAGMLATISVRTCIIDGELTACDNRGLPDFRALHFHDRDDELCVWAFDLLYLDGKDLTTMPLIDRKFLLEKLVYRTRDNWLRLSETFDDGPKLLVAAERMALEGIVSKKRDAPYHSGTKCDWIKVKCEAWRNANRDRGDLFKREKRR